MNLIPIFIGQSVIAVIVIITHVGLYLALRRIYRMLEDTHTSVTRLDHGIAQAVRDAVAERARNELRDRTGHAVHIRGHS